VADIVATTDWRPELDRVDVVPQLPARVHAQYDVGAHAELHLKHRLAAHRTWMVSDGEDIATPEIMRRLGSAMHRRVRLLPILVHALRLSGDLIGRESEIARLCGSLAVNIGHTLRESEWSPPIKFDEGLARTVAAYLSVPRQ
jgi:hypothetical protein